MLKDSFNLIDDGLVGSSRSPGETTRLAYMTDEAQEGRDQFLEKREPDWSPFPWYFWIGAFVQVRVGLRVRDTDHALDAGPDRVDSVAGRRCDDLTAAKGAPLSVTATDPRDQFSRERFRFRFGLLQVLEDWLGIAHWIAVGLQSEPDRGEPERAASQKAKAAGPSRHRTPIRS